MYSVLETLQAQPISQHCAVPDHSSQSHHVDQTADAVQNAELLVQGLHLLAMRPSIIALLPIPRLLMLPQTHDLRRLGSNVDPVDQRGEKHCGVQPGAQVIGCCRRDGRGREEWQ